MKLVAATASPTSDFFFIELTRELVDQIILYLTLMSREMQNEPTFHYAAFKFEGGSWIDDYDLYRNLLFHVGVRVLSDEAWEKEYRAVNPCKVDAPHILVGKNGYFVFSAKNSRGDQFQTVPLCIVDLERNLL